jgi:hypothetical protein
MHGVILVHSKDTKSTVPGIIMNAAPSVRSRGAVSGEQAHKRKQMYIIIGVVAAVIVVTLAIVLPLTLKKKKKAVVPGKGGKNTPTGPQPGDRIGFLLGVTVTGGPSTKPDAATITETLDDMQAALVSGDADVVVRQATVADLVGQAKYATLAGDATYAWMWPQDAVPAVGTEVSGAMVVAENCQPTQTCDRMLAAPESAVAAGNQAANQVRLGIPAGTPGLIVTQRMSGGNRLAVVVETTKLSIADVQTRLTSVNIGAVPGAAFVN